MANIRINSNPQRKQYVADDAQTVFPITFPFLANTDILVYKAGVLLTIGAGAGQYAIEGAGTASGGRITLVTASTAGDIITIVGAMPIDRTSIYSPTISNLTGTDLNNDFNRDIIMSKQLETTQEYLQLSYAPFAQVSQDLNETKDRRLPVLGASQIWRKNDGNTAIEPAVLPSFPVGSIGGSFSATGNFVTTDVSTGENDLKQEAIKFPTNTPTAGQVIVALSATETTWSHDGTGNVVGPAGATDNAVTRFDGTTGRLVQNSGVIIDDSDNVTGLNDLTTTGDTVFGGTVTLSVNPVLALEAATKSYVDGVAVGLEFKESVICASTLAYTVTYVNGADGVGATLTNADAQAAFEADGISPTVGQRVLIKDQADAAQNGIYTVTLEGDGASNWVLTRAIDHDEPSEMDAGCFVVIDTGTTLALTSWAQTTKVVTVGTTSVSFSQFTYGTNFPEITVDNIHINGNTISSLDTDGDINLTPDGTGEVMLKADPVDDLAAATKQYVDNSSSPSDRLILNVPQVAHGFVGGEWVYNNAGVYTAAIATSAAAAEVVGVVSAVADVDNFTLQMSGYTTSQAGLTANTVYFLSATAAGALQTAVPEVVGQVAKPLLVTDKGVPGETSGIMLTYRGNLVSDDAGVPAATQAQMEAATSLVTYVSPGRAKFHPGAGKAWISFTGVTTTTIHTSYNVASVGDNGTGDTTITIDVDFSSEFYATTGMSNKSSDSAAGQTTTCIFTSGGKTAGTLRVQTTFGGGSPALIDLADVNVIMCGDQ